jgi:alpha-L-arabinofuranosidase
VKKSIETGRWYDIRVDVAGNRVRCYLDGKLVHNTTIPEARTLFAAASTIRSTRDVIVKVVNTSDRDLDTRVKLSGAKDAAADAEAVVLKGSPEEENSLDQPEKVAPVRTPLAIAGAEFGHVFPAHSVTVLTFKHAAR